MLCSACRALVACIVPDTNSRSQFRQFGTLCRLQFDLQRVMEHAILSSIKRILGIVTPSQLRACSHNTYIFPFKMKYAEGN